MPAANISMWRARYWQGTANDAAFLKMDMPADNPASTQTCSLTIRNNRGLHARASAKFVQCADAFDAEIFVLREGQRVDATSIMGLMMLAASRGATIQIEATGPQASDAIAALTDLVENGFGETT